MKNTTPLQTLQEYFGYKRFWPDQEEVITCVLEKKDTLAVMPTGSGKSIIYQLPALMLENLTIVISPLIALMQDQVESLKSQGISAAFLNSMLNSAESESILRKLEEKQLKLLYLSPEKLLSAAFLDFISKLKVSLIAVDEAHCISIWGHDFRPEYSKLSILKEKFPETTMVALTATADKLTRNDIIDQLKITDPQIHVASFNRPNLSLNVLPGIDRFRVIRDFILEKNKSSGIIYCLSRKSTEDLSAKLNANGIKSVFYHAGMERSEREKAQHLFIRDDIPVICATIAFGMGIDKSNVRWVIHYNMPKSLESFYQEIGRAGRDGLDSETLMFYSFRDVILLRKFAEQSGQPAIQLNKLQRIQQYAEATSCRRKVLLSYFNEHKEEDCGNCDVCLDPPSTFDGSTIAQKALSAIVRLNENVASGMLIDILKGSGKREIFEMNYHQIKTYGAGKDIGYLDWQQYLLQLLHLGLFDIAYNDGQKLKITSIGRKVLFENKKVKLVKVLSSSEMLSRKKSKVKKLTKKEKLTLELRSILNDLRKTIADKENIPAYVIFNDQTMAEMARMRPDCERDMLSVPGMTNFKLEKYGKQFLDPIIDFKIAHKDRGSTNLYTKKLLDSGKDIHEIAKMRNLSVLTIISHLIHIYEKENEFDVFKHIPSVDLDPLLAYLKSHKKELSQKEVYEHFRGKYEYHQVNLGFVRFKKEQEGSGSD